MIKTAVIFIFLSFFSQSAFCENIQIKPVRKPKPDIIKSIKKPWTDYVIDFLIVERDNQGNIKVMVKAKNLGDNDKSPLWVAVGINRPGAKWIELNAIGTWYALVDKARLGAAVEIKAMADSKKIIREINEDNNFCSVYLAPAATRGQSNCY